MAAYDNVAMPGAPAAPSYAAPLLNFSPIAGLMDDYIKGTQQARTLRMQNAFPDGMPTTDGQPPRADGKNVDISSILNTGAKLGGFDTVAGMLPTLQGLQIGQGNANVIPGQGSAPAPATQPQSDSAPARQPAPVRNAHGSGEATNPDTLANIIQAAIPDPVIAGRVIAAASRNLNVDPGQVIDQNNPTVQAYIKSANGGVIPTGGTAGGPPPTQDALPPGMDEASAQKYEDAANEAYRRAAIVSALPNGAAQANALSRYADQQMEKAKTIRQAIAKNTEQAPEYKTYLASREPGESFPAFQARNAGTTEVAKEDVKNYNDENKKIQAQAENSFNGIQKAKLMKSLTLQPDYYSGPFAEGMKSYNQFKSLFGSNPNSALPAEAFDKVANDMLAEQIKSMGNSGVGRVLQSEVKIMSQAIASLKNTPAGNRALAEILSRVYQQNQDLGQIARSIPQKPGQMSRGLQDATASYLQAHPLFTEDEIQNPARLAAPDAPPSSVKWSPDQARNWATQHGLQSGDYLRLNGKYVRVP